MPDDMDDEWLGPAGEPADAPGPNAPEDTEHPAEDQGGGAPGSCWHCGEPNPDPAAIICATCGRTLASPDLLLTFADGEVSLVRGQSVLLGHPGGPSPHAQMFAAFPNVSRRHAVVGVGDNGEAWIRDEGSLNGTFVNNKDISDICSEERLPGRREPLRNGDTVRLAAHATAQVRIRPDRPG